MISTDARHDWIGGFVNFATATYTADPNGVLTQVGDGETNTQAQPILVGVGGPPFYDLAAKRWIPVNPDQTSPDGSAYAYPDIGITVPSHDGIEVVTVATGQGRLLPYNASLQHAPGSGLVDSFDGRYVYISNWGYSSSTSPSTVWRLETTTGTYIELSQASGIMLVRDGYAWVGLMNPADPSAPQPADGSVAFDSIARINLATGVETTWIYRPGQDVTLLGLDLSGRPVVSIAKGPSFDQSHATVLLLSAAGDTGTLISNGQIDALRMQRDVGRIWFGTAQGIYLWTPAGGLQKVISSTQPLLPAGFCV